VRRTDREDELGLTEQGGDRPQVTKGDGARARLVAPALGGPEHLVAVRLQCLADRRPHPARVQEGDDHRTSASTKAKNATEMTPFIVKNAASSLRRSPGRTSVCS